MTLSVACNRASRGGDVESRHARGLRIGTEWYWVDLLFFHQRLRSLLIVELKAGKFTHADAGQMNLYLNYARKHWVNPDENPPADSSCAQNAMPRLRTIPWRASGIWYLP